MGTSQAVQGDAGAADGQGARGGSRQPGALERLAYGATITDGLQGESQGWGAGSDSM